MWKLMWFLIWTIDCGRGQSIYFVPDHSRFYVTFEPFFVNFVIDLFTVLGSHAIPSIVQSVVLRLFVFFYYCVDFLTIPSIYLTNILFSGLRSLLYVYKTFQAMHCFFVFFTIANLLFTIYTHYQSLKWSCKPTPFVVMSVDKSKPESFPLAKWTYTKKLIVLTRKIVSRCHSQLVFVRT